MPDFNDPATQADFEKQLKRFNKNPKIRSPEALARLVAIRKAKKRKKKSRSAGAEQVEQVDQVGETPSGRPWYDWEPI